MFGAFRYASRTLLLVATVALVSAVEAAEPTTGLEGIDHFAIHVSDLERSARWYERIFGFTVVNKWKTTWMVGRKNIRVGLFLRPNAKAIDDLDKYLVFQHVAFKTTNAGLKRAQEQLHVLGVQFEGPEDLEIATALFFRDPDGHLLELIAYKK